MLTQFVFEKRGAYQSGDEKWNIEKSKQNQTKSEKSAVNYQSKRSYKNKSDWSSFIS